MKVLTPFLALLCGAFLCLLAGAQSRKQTSHNQPVSASGNATKEIMAGEKLFETHCGRCHTLPEDLSPREARAVVRQMRVRAMLSEQDERRLLEFLAP